MKLLDLIKCLKAYSIEDKRLIIFAIYLLDWKYSILNDQPLLNVTWYYGNYGPEIIKEHTTIVNIFDLVEEVINSNEKFEKCQECIDIEDFILFVNDKLERLTDTELQNLVYSTYPMIRSEKYSTLPLSLLVAEYKMASNRKDNFKMLSLKIDIEKVSFFSKIKKLLTGNYFI